MFVSQYRLPALLTCVLGGGEKVTRMCLAYVPTYAEYCQQQEALQIRAVTSPHLLSHSLQGFCSLACISPKLVRVAWLGLRFEIVVDV